MSKYFNKTVAYLQDSDFDANGNIINPDIPKDIPVIIMIQANFCGYCTQAKPDFRNFAEANKGKVFTATIQGDGDQKGEKELAARLDKISPGFRGYPEYVKYKGGVRQEAKIGGRKEADLNKFANV